VTETHGVSGKPTWGCTMTRKDSSYGTYTVKYNQDGYDTSSGINAFPDINPMGSEVTSSSAGS
jgi:hypothetical protein